MQRMVCFCDNCTGFMAMEPDEDEAQVPPEPCRMLMVYPSYDWCPPRTRGAVNVELEQVVHQYLQRIHRIPRSLPPDMLQVHKGLINTPATAQLVFSMDVPPHITKAQFKAYLTAQSSSSEVLWLNLCGHGKAGADLILADGSLVTMTEIAQTLTDMSAKLSEPLKKGGTLGTVVISMNTCSAEPPGVVPSGSGWHAGLPFKYVLLFSSGPEEYANHFARLLARLAAERPPYTQLQARADELWVETRDASSRPSQWRGPPTIILGDKYGGRFLEPASPYTI